MTIPGTMMGVFENLATADVASFLVAYLQHYDGLETVFAGVDLKLNFLENWAGRREDFINELKEGYVSASNSDSNTPPIFSSSSQLYQEPESCMPFIDTSVTTTMKGL